MIRVDGRLKRHYIPSIGGYKYEIIEGYRYFKELEHAISYANAVYYKTGVILGVRDVTRKKLLDRKISIG